MLNFQGVSCRRGGRPVLDMLDLTVAAGECYVLLGGNGAGKSTAIAAACGRIRPASGHVRVDCRDPARDRGVRRAIGWMPQRNAIHAHLTVRENLDVFASYAGLPRGARAAAVGHAMDATGLAPVARIRAGRLSGGYQRRASLAAALLRASHLMLLDEPSTGMDLDAVEALAGSVADLRARGVAVLLTTHDLGLAEQVSDRVGFLVGGRIALEGSAADLVRTRLDWRTHVSVSLRAPPCAEREAVLRDAGLAPAGAPLLWSSFLDLPPWRAPDMGGTLAAAGIEVTEVRARAAGLRDLFAHVVGEEAGAP